jgi:hypothetical protein
VEAVRGVSVLSVPRLLSNSSSIWRSNGPVAIAIAFLLIYIFEFRGADVDRYVLLLISTDDACYHRRLAQNRNILHCSS